MAEEGLENLRAQGQREIKSLSKELQYKQKGLAEMAALLVLQNNGRLCSEDAKC
jgi:hypothetical protein